MRELLENLCNSVDLYHSGEGLHYSDSGFLHNVQYVESEWRADTFGRTCVVGVNRRDKRNPEAYWARRTKGHWRGYFKLYWVSWRLRPLAQETEEQWWFRQVETRQRPHTQDGDVKDQEMRALQGARIFMAARRLASKNRSGRNIGDLPLDVCKLVIMFVNMMTSTL